ncbi:MAG: endolytic transglycosylase MltG [Yoonia sp.]|nr:endolytic transglycosylase MltG [Yoonia sp.]
MWRHIASNALTFFIVFLFLFAGIIGFAVKKYSAPGPLAQAICLQVKGGSNMRAVALDLQEQGAVASATVLRIGADYAEKTSQLKAGSFLVPENASMEQIVDIVTRGGANTCGTEVVFRIGVTSSDILVRELDPATNRFVEVAKFDPTTEETPEMYASTVAEADTLFRLAVAEGVTSWQVVDAMSRIDLLDIDTAEVPAEGSLAPDSYDFKTGTTVSSLLERMTSKQSQILAEAWAGRVDGLPLKSPEEALVLASLIEKETGVPTERRQVASVFVNRLNQGIKLQTDPAVIYGVTKGEGVLGRGLRRSELDRETPWNTYIIPALPPTPIANPGRASIEAALDPDTTEYIFFVADGTGGHAFAVTLAEHNRNVEVWRKIEAEQATADEG